MGSLEREDKKNGDTVGERGQRWKLKGKKQTINGRNKVEEGDKHRRQRWRGGDSGGRTREGETDGEGRQTEEGNQMGQGERC